MPDIQIIAVGLVVVLAALYLVRQSLRTWLGKKGCGGGCGCSKTANPESGKESEVLIPIEQLTVRKR